MKFKMSLTFFMSWFALLVIAESAEISHPVILMPGITGSPIEAKLNKPSVPNKRCAKETPDYITLWLDMKHICPMECFVDNMELRYNATTGRTYNCPGVDTRVPSYLVQNNGTHYFGEFIEVLEKHGYVRYVSLHIASYDWRRGPHEIEEYWNNLRQLIIKTYQENGNKRVSLVVHSMGGPMALTFLHQQTQAFKDKYINSLISLSGAYGGAMDALSVFIQGIIKHLLPIGLSDYQPECNSWDWKFDIIKVLFHPSLQLVANSFPSLYWLFPSPIAWDQSDVLLQTPTKNYSLANIHEMFKDMNRTTEQDIYQRVLPYNLNFTAPGVEVYCLYGQNMTTLGYMEFQGGNHFPWKKLVKHQDDGDGTVNLRSLQTCRQWKSQQKEPFHEMAFMNVNHMGMTTNETVIQFVLKALQIVN